MKMFRITQNAVSLLGNVLKIKPRVTFDRRYYRAIIRLPDSFISKAFCSQDSKNAVKNPLSNLISKETQAHNKLEENSEDEDAKQKREQSWKRMKYTLLFFGFSFTCIGVYLIMELGKPRLEEDGTPISDEFSQMAPWKQYIFRTLSELDYYRRLLKEPSREKLLPDLVKHPFYHPEYTLVLEFTDVLVHPDWTYKTGWRFKKRPGLDHFLESLSGIYEIVIYTAEQGMTVFPIVEALDPKNLINYKLVRDATLFMDGVHVKDLDKLNRDLKKVIVIDWDGESTKYHPENVFQIPRWNGDDEDFTMIHLTSFLLAISQNQIEDVRDVITYYNQYDDPLTIFRERQKKLIEMAEADAAEEAKSGNKLPIKKWTPSFLRKPF